MLTPTDLTTEYAPNPLNIDTPQPRFGWLLHSDRRAQSQSAYQIRVATSPERLQTGSADKWDSGKVSSDRSVNVPYAGGGLSSDEICYWQLRVWDQDDRASAYSEPASFTMGLLNENDWTGSWIGAQTDVASPLLRSEFDLAKPVSRARLHISGLGWYELYLNGQRVGDHVLDPVTTDYTRRILYVTYDVTDMLQTGANAVGVMLGNGWYCEPGWEHRYGDSPRLRLQLNVEFADGSADAVTPGAGAPSGEGPHRERASLDALPPVLPLPQRPGLAIALRGEALGWPDASVKDTEQVEENRLGIRLGRTKLRAVPEATASRK